MSSLWTPEGEHRVPRPGEETVPNAPAGGPPPGAGRPGASRPPGGGGAAGAGGDPGEPTEEELRAFARELAEAPVEDIVANHCYGLFELAALHLSQQPVNLAAARLAIDAMGALVDGLGERLGGHTATLADGLTQLRLAYVRIAEAAPTAATAGDGVSPNASASPGEP